MSSLQHHFPQKLAMGGNFCNRVQEQCHLRDNIIGARPSLIISPRRYGKTSLGLYIVNKLSIMCKIMARQ